MIMPILIGGFGNFSIPLLLCSSDMIFPRLNALSLWLVFVSLFLMLLAVFLEGGVNAGRTFYVPSSIINSSSIDLMFSFTFGWIKFSIRINESYCYYIEGYIICYYTVCIIYTIISMKYIFYSYFIVNTSSCIGW